MPERFKRLEHADKKLFGIIAAVDMSEMLKKGVGGGGLCTRIQDETFSLESPGGFQTKCF